MNNQDNENNENAQNLNNKETSTQNDTLQGCLGLIILIVPLVWLFSMCSGGNEITQCQKKYRDQFIEWKGRHPTRSEMTAITQGCVQAHQNK